MTTEDFQANWRGARRYQFDEETRRKREALIAKQSRESASGQEHTNVEVFRQIKHEEPEKFAVLVEDLKPQHRRAVPFVIAVIGVAVIAFATTFVAI